MASIHEAFLKVIGLEFNSPANALHYNDGEQGYTFMGIYEHAHPTWAGWSYIKEVLRSNGISAASSICYNNKPLVDQVELFYKTEFWDKMRLNEVASQKIAEELFVFAVNAGIPIAVRVAQRVLGVQDDGILGSKTIAALNQFNPAVFDVEYDKGEIAHYELLTIKNPNFKKFLNGWKNRAVAV